MSDDAGDARGRDGADGVGSADEQALTALFAALVQDAEPSTLTGLEVKRLAGAARRDEVARRVNRLRYARNGLIAAVFLGVVALIVPHLGDASNQTTASSGAISEPAAAPAALPDASDAAGSPAAESQAGPSATAAGGGVDAASSGSHAAATARSSPAVGPAAPTSAPASSAAGAASSGAPGAATAAGSAMGSAGSGSAGGSSAVGGSSNRTPAGIGPKDLGDQPYRYGTGPVKAASVDGAAGRCLPLTAEAAAAVRAAFPAGYFLSPGVLAPPSSSCATGALLLRAAGPGYDVTVVLTAAKSGACRTAARGCTAAAPSSGIPNTYLREGTSGPTVFSYGDGLQIELSARYQTAVRQGDATVPPAVADAAGTLAGAGRAALAALR